MTPGAPSPKLPPIALDLLRVARASSSHAAELQALSERLIVGPIAEQQKRLDDAKSQRESADTLRNRATRASDDAHRQELLDRAARFEARADVIERGTVMPRELRYGLDSLRLVAEAREALLAAAVALDHLDPDEVSRYMTQLLPQGSTEDIAIGHVPIHVEAPAMLARNAIGSALELLGAYVGADGITRLRPAELRVATDDHGAATATPKAANMAR